MKKPTCDTCPLWEKPFGKCKNWLKYTDAKSSCISHPDVDVAAWFEGKYEKTDV